MTRPSATCPSSAAPVALPLGAVAFTSIGVLLGSLLPFARSAWVVGLLLFFPAFLLGAGDAPPDVMGSIVQEGGRSAPADNAVSEPWLGLDTATSSLIAIGALAVRATVVAARRMAL